MIAMLSWIVGAIILRFAQNVTRWVRIRTVFRCQRGGYYRTHLSFRIYKANIGFILHQVHL